MQRSIEKLYKIFKLEAEFDFSNKAVVGGLEKLTESWKGEARADGIPEEKIRQVSAMLGRYPELEKSERIAVLKEIGRVLDVAGIKYLQDPGRPATSQPKNNLAAAQNGSKAD